MRAERAEIASSVAHNPPSLLTQADDDGIVVEGQGSDGRQMRASSVPQALRERLGHEATIGLVEYVDVEQSAWSDRVLNLSVERFERRMAQELGELRVAVVREIHETRSETIKWAFLFWISQMAAFVAVLGFLVRNGIR